MNSIFIKILTPIANWIMQFPLSILAAVGSILILVGSGDLFETGKLFVGMSFVTAVFLWLFEPEYYYSHKKSVQEFLDNKYYSSIFFCCWLTVGVYSIFVGDTNLFGFAVTFTVCGLVWFWRTLDAIHASTKGESP